MTTTYWRDEAACLDCVDPELFFTYGGPKTEDDAISICMACPVRRPCLDDALLTERRHSLHALHGIRGGLTAAQRKALVREGVREAVKTR